MPYDAAHGRPSEPVGQPSDEVGLEAFERALLGRPASMGRREVSRGAGVSIRSARKFWHAMGFPVVQEGDAMFTEADLAELPLVGPAFAEVDRRHPGLDPGRRPRDPAAGGPGVGDVPVPAHP